MLYLCGTDFISHTFHKITEHKFYVVDMRKVIMFIRKYNIMDNANRIEYFVYMEHRVFLTHTFNFPQQWLSITFPFIIFEFEIKCNIFHTAAIHRMSCVQALFTHNLMENKLFSFHCQPSNQPWYAHSTHSLNQFESKLHEIVEAKPRQYVQ